MARRELDVGRLAKAQDLYGQIHRAFPKSFDAALGLGVALYRQGRHQDALACADDAGAIEPDNPMFMHLRACAMNAAGRHDDAIAEFRRALDRLPALAEGWLNLADACIRAGDLPQAADALCRLADLRPADEQTWFDLNVAYAGGDMLGKAQAAIGQVLQSRPGSVPALLNLGRALAKQERLDEAMACYQSAAALRPDLPAVHVCVGNILARKSSWAAARDQFALAVSLRPDHAMAHFFLGIALLQLGQLAEGWKEYAWRWRWAGFKDRPLRLRFETEPWDGRDLGSEPILIHYEQGYGDTIQFVRYLPMVTARGGKVVLEAPPPLVRLLKRAKGVREVVPFGTALGEAPNHAALLDLPGLFGTTLENIPADVPYLDACPDDVAAWRQRLGREKRLKVGLVWAGGAGNSTDSQRSMDPGLMRPLTDVQGAAFYSLQIGRNADLSRFPPGAVADLSPYLNDFADTAAAVSQLDLVISVDTAVVHLAGAMGKSVWMLLHFLGEWRWMDSRKLSPWYPTLRIFRQEKSGDWSDIVTQASQGLRALVTRK